MVVKNGLACGIMLALVGCATKPVSNEQATPVPEKQIISTALLEKRDGTGEVTSSVTRVSLEARVFPVFMLMVKRWQI